MGQKIKHKKNRTAVKFGRLGGMATSLKYGKKYFQKLSLLGKEARRKRKLLSMGNKP